MDIIDPFAAPPCQQVVSLKKTVILNPFRAMAMRSEANDGLLLTKEGNPFFPSLLD